MILHFIVQAYSKKHNFIMQAVYYFKCCKLKTSNLQSAPKGWLFLLDTAFSLYFSECLLKVQQSYLHAGPSLVSQWTVDGGISSLCGFGCPEDGLSDQHSLPPLSHGKTNYGRVDYCWCNSIVCVFPSVTACSFECAGYQRTLNDVFGCGRCSKCH